MAIYYWVGTTSQDWNTAANWGTTDGVAGGYSTPPTSGDDALFTALSASCTVTGTTAACKKLDFSQNGGYGSSTAVTFKITNSTDHVTVNGDLLLSNNVTAGLTYSGSGQLRVGAGTGARTLTSNYGATGLALTSIVFTLVGGTSVTFALADDWYIESFYLQSGGSYTFSGSQTIYVTSSLNAANPLTEIAGSGPTLVLYGAGSITWDNVLVQMTMNINTSGSLTIGTNSGSKYGFDTSTLTALSVGSVTCNGKFYLGVHGNCTINTGLSVKWNDVTTENSSSTVTLGNDLYITGNFTPGGNTNTITFNGSYSVFVKGNLSVGNNITTGTGGGIKGNATLMLQDWTTGTSWAGTWAAGGITAIVKINTVVYSVNSHAILATQAYYSTGSLTLNP